MFPVAFNGVAAVANAVFEVGSLQFWEDSVPWDNLSLLANQFPGLQNKIKVVVAW